jgi:hypothetical protein
MDQRSQHYYHWGWKRWKMGEVRHSGRRRWQTILCQGWLEEVSPVVETLRTTNVLLERPDEDISKTTIGLMTTFSKVVECVHNCHGTKSTSPINATDLVKGFWTKPFYAHGIPQNPDVHKDGIPFVKLKLVSSFSSTFASLRSPSSNIDLRNS